MEMKRLPFDIECTLCAVDQNFWIEDDNPYLKVLIDNGLIEPVKTWQLTNMGKDYFKTVFNHDKAE
jgi:hypothetical protein